MKDSSAPAMTTAANRDYWNDWARYLTVEVNKARTTRTSILASIRNSDQVRARARAIRERVWGLIGGPLEKTPLNARTVGSLVQNAYRIENVIFESQPEVFVTANLYLPTSGRPPYPAILSPPGHYWEGKAALDYQHLYQNLARTGYVVLAFDLFGQGERQQFLDPMTGRSRFHDHEPTNEHDQAGRPLVLLGATFAQYCVWDAVRALDYLESRIEVDSHRIGCVGHSGGATMTMYLCALEPRIQVAVEVEGHTRNFSGPNYDAPGSVDDAEQNIVGSLAVGIDRSDLLWAFAPRPLLMTYTPQDVAVSPFYLQAVHEVFEEVKSAYDILGASNRVRLIPASLPHAFDAFNRSETYAWFNQWLGNNTSDTRESPLDRVPSHLLDCTSTGQVLTSLGGRSVVRVNADRAADLIAKSAFREPTSRQMNHLRSDIQEKLRNLLVIPPQRYPLQGETLSTGNQQDVRIEEFVFRSEEHIRVPGWFLKLSHSHQPLATILFVTEGGKNAVADGSNTMQMLVRAGFAVCAVDLRGCGSMSPRYPGSDPYRYYDGAEHLKEDFAWASLVLGKPPLGQRVWDFLRCLDYLETRSDVDRAHIYVLGFAGGGLTVLAGAALDQRPRAVLCDGVLADYKSIFESELYAWGLTWYVPGILREFDLPNVAAAVAPRPLWMVNVVDARGEIVPDLAARAGYEVTLDTYSRLNASEKLRFFVISEEEKLQVIRNWLRSD